jgi:hypothetical protein
VIRPVAPTAANTVTNPTDLKRLWFFEYLTSDRCGIMRPHQSRFLGNSWLAASHCCRQGASKAFPWYPSDQRHRENCPSPLQISTSEW